MSSFLLHRRSLASVASWLTPILTSAQHFWAFITCVLHRGEQGAEDGGGVTVASSTSSLTGNAKALVMLLLNTRSRDNHMFWISVQAWNSAKKVAQGRQSRTSAGNCRANANANTRCVVLRFFVRSSVVANECSSSEAECACLILVYGYVIHSRAPTFCA